MQNGAVDQRGTLPLVLLLCSGAGAGAAALGTIQSRISSGRSLTRDQTEQKLQRVRKEGSLIVDIEAERLWGGRGGGKGGNLEYMKIKCITFPTERRRIRHR